MNRNEQHGLDFLDMLAIMAFVVQLADYDATLRQVGNNDIMDEMRRDVAELKAQNAEILRLLRDKK